MMEKEKKENPMKGYDKTNRNFLVTDEDIQKENREKAKLQPEKYPVDDNLGEKNKQS